MATRRDILQLGFCSLVLAACRATPSIADDDAPSCAMTADNIEGPFYKAGAPNRAVLAPKDSDGERLVITGTVRSTACAILANATLDIWQADARGGYDNDGWGLRGRMQTDKQGRWRVDTIVPGRYLNGKRYRPAHVHVKLRAEGHAELTTQLYFAGDPYNKGDDFIVDSLIMKHAKENGARRARFDFVLASST
jgi:protocatechuate 3,4-dioxygenase beta subunit